MTVMGTPGVGLDIHLYAHFNKSPVTDEGEQGFYVNNASLFGSNGELQSKCGLLRK